jgi:hypothetical protein
MSLKNTDVFVAVPMDGFTTVLKLICGFDERRDRFRWFDPANIVSD